MDFNEYQLLAERTSSMKDGNALDRAASAAMGLLGETGELIDHVKKILFQGHVLDPDKIKDEAGDVLWYLAESCSANDVRMDSISCSSMLDREEDSVKLLQRLLLDCLRLGAVVGRYAETMEMDVSMKAFVSTKSTPVHLSRIFRKLVMLLEPIGLLVEDVAENNIEKLKKRYPEGFSVEKSTNRSG
jgi:NTP pyrophosphatase (non-canonical NTP hydrolase)